MVKFLALLIPYSIYFEKRDMNCAYSYEICSITYPLITNIIVELIAELFRTIITLKNISIDTNLLVINTFFVFNMVFFV